MVEFYEGGRFAYNITGKPAAQAALSLEGFLAFFLEKPLEAIQKLRIG